MGLQWPGDKETGSTGSGNDGWTFRGSNGRAENDGFFDNCVTVFIVLVALPVVTTLGLLGLGVAKLAGLL
jgi:hypothetical protein